MAWQDREEPLGGAVIVALIGLWFAIGIAALEGLFAAFTPDPDLRFFSFLWGLAYTGVAIGLLRCSRGAVLWGIALSGFSYLILGITRHIVLSSDLLILIPLVWEVSAGYMRAGEEKSSDPNWHPPRLRRARSEAEWFPPPMDDPLLARLRPPRDWD